MQVCLWWLNMKNNKSHKYEGKLLALGVYAKLSKTLPSERLRNNLVLKHESQVEEKLLNGIHQIKDKLRRLKESLSL